jgi:hypothetical protein
MAITEPGTKRLAGHSVPFLTIDTVRVLFIAIASLHGLGCAAKGVL